MTTNDKTAEDRVAARRISRLTAEFTRIIAASVQRRRDQIQDNWGWGDLWTTFETGPGQPLAEARKAARRAARDLGLHARTQYVPGRHDGESGKLFVCDARPTESWPEHIRERSRRATADALSRAWRAQED
jgi:hypothetical protein